MESRLKRVIPEGAKRGKILAKVLKFDAAQRSILFAEEDDEAFLSALEVFEPSSCAASTEHRDHTLEVLQAIAQPFKDAIADSPDGIRQLLNEPLPTRLPVVDHVYDEFKSSFLRRNLIPHRELPVRKLSLLFSYALLGGTELSSASSEASYQIKWDDLTFKPMTEVVNGTGLDVRVDRNVTDPTSTTSEADLIVTSGELVCDQEEKKSGNLRVPTNELFQTLAGMSPMYDDNATRCFIVGVATSGNTIAYYALDRCLSPPVIVVGPLTVSTPEIAYRVLQCSLNILRFAITVGEERQRRSLADGLALGHQEISRYFGVTRKIQFSPSYVKKTIEPFQTHEALGFTCMEFVTKAYAQTKSGKWGKAWSASPPKCTRAGVYSVQVQPVGVRKLPQNEDELRIAMRCVLNAVRELHEMKLVHRDIRWPNILLCAPGWFLMDFETVWEADKKPLCMAFSAWSGMSLPNGCYTKECDLFLVGKLLQEFSYENESFRGFKSMLCQSLTSTSVLTVEEVLSHEWLNRFVSNVM